MSELSDLDLTQMLARAFDRAWERYYLDQSGTLSKEAAGTSLAKHLVALARQGEKDERALAASGFLHLISLTEPWPLTALQSESDVSPNKLTTSEPTFFHLPVDGAQAKFIHVWRIRSGAALRWRIFHFQMDDAKAKFLPEWHASVSAITFST